ncbi:MAG: hypothetical protein KC505_02610 [Myxococcales bacterium]|nr:hypothetical protein [Myxococcales bacterium]USN51091.1 MAG: hypothetical protein H6731_01385 [Myxococcales bacterium]
MKFVIRSAKSIFSTLVILFFCSNIFAGEMKEIDANDEEMSEVEVNEQSGITDYLGYLCPKLFSIFTCNQCEPCRTCDVSDKMETCCSGCGRCLCGCLKITGMCCVACCEILGELVEGDCDS